MQTLRSILALFLIIVFIPSPTVWGRDILRMGGSGGAPAGGGSGGGGGNPGGAGGGMVVGRPESSARANDLLIRTSNSIDAVLRLQEAARNDGGAIHNPNNPSQMLPTVPDGLGEGGLKVADGIGADPSLWQGAQLPGQQVEGGKTVVTVVQDHSQALLTWQSFNVGKETILNFDQSAGGADRANWTVFNKVADPGALPSQILGQINAEGQVYVINPNGIIFGNNSQVNVRGLTVSSLPINMHLVENGLLNNPDAQFLFSGLPMAAGANGSPAYTPEPPPAALGHYGDVLVMAGAQLNSTQAEDGSGGRILLVGPNVKNDGIIRTPGGQAILAAGSQVGIAAHASSDASLRGLDVYIGAVQGDAGHALNSGLIESMLGNVTLAGSKVELTGAIDSGTSVALNGRVDLLASYGAVSNPLSSSSSNSSYVPFLNSQTGTVLLGADSLIRILPQLGSTDKVAATELALRSRVNIEGRTFYMGEGATILAPNAIVDVNAGVWKPRSAGNNRVAEFVNADGQIYLDQGAQISVAGTTGVEVPLSQVLLTIDLRGSELADSPVQRDDVLRGQTITVDIRKQGNLDGVDWVGSPIADVSGYLGLIERTVAELTVAGGDVNLNAGGSIVMQEHSLVDVSGGWVEYAGGGVETTRLLLNGRVVDIADASPDVKYDGIYTGSNVVNSPNWGATSETAHALAPKGISYEESYTEGAAGGSLSLTAVSMALDGSLRGSTVTGERQFENPAQYASLLLAFETRDTSISADRFPVTGQGAPDVVFANEVLPAQVVDAFDPEGDGAAVALPQERKDTVTLSADLLGKDGFGNLAVRNREGSVTVGSGVTLEGQAGGALALEGANVTVDGAVRIAGGTIDLAAYNVSYDTINRLEYRPNPVNPQPEAGRGIARVGEHAVLSTAGMIVDNRQGADAGRSQPYAIKGGDISVRGFETQLAEGSVVDVSGGAYVSSGGSVRYGDGGAITLEGGRDLAVQSVLGGSLQNKAELLGYSGGRGGSLSLLAPVVRIGGDVTATDALVLPETFFNTGGFSDFTIRGIGARTQQADRYVAGVTVTEGTVIRPITTSLRATLLEGGVRMDKVVLPEGVRPASNITLGATGASDSYGNQVLARGEVTLEQGAVIQTDAGGSVAFEANAITLLGSVITPGGQITVRGGSSLDTNVPASDRALPTVVIGDSARLLARGQSVLVPSVLGLREGRVLSGGSINVSGNIVAESGAVLDVSGTSGVLDLPTAYAVDRIARGGSISERDYTPVTIDTAGGTITLSGSRLLVSDATLLGNAGGADAAGGTLQVSSGRFYGDGETSTTADVNLEVVQGGNLLAPLAAGQRIGQSVQGADGQVIGSGGHFAADTFAAGGFDNLTLGGNVAFTESVTINARGNLRVAAGGVLKGGDGDVVLNAAHVGIGQDFVAPLDPSQKPFLFTKNVPGIGESEHRFAPEHGNGTLRVQAGSIELGTLSLDGIGRADFEASAEGAIRGNGVFNIVGEAGFSGGQIHPTTAGDFTITAFDYSSGGLAKEGVVTFAGGNNSLLLPYSAGGTLSVYASQIEQGGQLRAPFGVINLGWDGTGTAPVNAISGTSAPVASSVTLTGGSVTSVSAVGPDGKGITLPYGIVLNGISWIDPRGVDITLGDLPEKKVNLSAKDLITEEGSQIDLRGGGDLFAYRWVPGLGGTKDVLASDGSFAVLPGYASTVAPQAPYNPSPVTTALNGDAGYANKGLKAGDQVYLSADSGLPAGVYTLLPARYALLEGAFLITPKAASPIGASASVQLADGSRLVSGYRVNGLTGGAQSGKVLSLFEVASSEVVMQRSQYDMYYANAFLAAAAADRGVAGSRLPQDSGQLVFSASRQMSLEGSLSADALGKGRGSLVDINSALDIMIGNAGGEGQPGVLMLDVDALNAFSAASLLVGGSRHTVDGVSTVAVNSANVLLDNAGNALTGSDIILVGRDSVRLADGAQINASGSGAAVSAEAIRIGDAEAQGSGDGALVRVSRAADARAERVGVSEGNTASLFVGSGAEVRGGAVVLDSSANTTIDSQASLHADHLSLGSGRISLVLDEAGSSGPTEGLILSGEALESILGSARSFGLSSYSSIDIYGSGTVGSAQVEQLVLNAPRLSAAGGEGGAVTFTADTLRLENTTGTTADAGALPQEGSLRFEAGEVYLGNGELTITGYGDTTVAAAEAVRLEGWGGVRTGGNLSLLTPRIMAVAAAQYALKAGGLFSLERPLATADTGVQADLGLGAKLAVEGEAVALNSDILLPSGVVDVRARTGDIVIGSEGVARIDVGGVSQSFYDKQKTTDGGSVTLAADTGRVVVDALGVVDVSAPAGTASAGGSVRVHAAEGGLVLRGALQGGSGGTFDLDASSLLDAGSGNAVSSLAALDAALNTGGFGGGRNYRLRSGDVVADGLVTSRNYTVSADAGTITVSGVIDASGHTGGQIELRAANDVIIDASARLSVAADAFSNAGKGGKVFLEAGAQTDAVVNHDAQVDIRSGSVIDLSVAAKTEQSASLGQHSGVLHLRAPQNAAATDMGVATIAGDIRGASHIAVEGYKLYDLTGTNGQITQALQSEIRQDGVAFLGASGTSLAHYRQMLERISGGDAALADQLILQTGAEIINRSGDLSLGTTATTASADWNLASFRFGERGSAGMLTLRAAGDVIFHNALSDGFSGGSSLWLSPLMTPNDSLPANAQTWAYRISAGADLSAADFRRVLGAGELAEGKGSLQLGKNAGSAVASGGTSALTSSLITNYFQTIRTGSGDIDITAAGNVHLLNPFASIYTAGTAVANPTHLYKSGDFVLPLLRNTGAALSQGSLGVLQQNYPVQYSHSGGDVHIRAGGDIGRYTSDYTGKLVADSSRQLPGNWLYRRGYVDDAGNYGRVYIGNVITNITDAAASTSWWVDFSNFFQSVGALGGGNVSLLAGRNVSNVDAVIPTNARAPRGTPDAAKLVELGGGDLLVRAGNNIDGGVYYVERGEGALVAGNVIKTNASRSMNRNIVQNVSTPVYEPEETWLPTTLFLGKGSFDIRATGDVLLGPVANAFLLPQGVGNRYWYKTYFNTYAPDSAVTVSSVTGDITLRNEVTMADSSNALPFLQAWLARQNLLAGTGSNNAAYYQPWLRLVETAVDPFATLLTVAPPSLSLTAFSADVNLSGSYHLFPSPTGQLEIMAAGGIHALTPNGVSDRILPGQRVASWSTSLINLSDANPALLPGVTNPFAYLPLVGSATASNNTTRAAFLLGVNRYFGETGATNSVLQTQQALHAAELLHRNDPNPVYLYATGGDISGLTLFSAKPARIAAARDIADIGFYLQNLNAGQISVVSAGRDIIAYHANAERRLLAMAGGNAFNTGRQTPLSGDIQLGGPGVLQVFAGRNLDLGVGPGGSNGLSSGVTTIGNRRNPFLPSAGAEIVAGAGIGQALGLVDSELDFPAFIAAFLDPQTGGELAQRYLEELAKIMSIADAGEAWQAFQNLGQGEQAHFALGIFYLVLRDTGRDYNNPEAETYGSYENGFRAISLLFPEAEDAAAEDGSDTPSRWNGDIALTARQFKTAAGGDISLFAPGGGLTVGFPSTSSRADQGILTEAGGNINIFTRDSVAVGASRIFTLRGGNIGIWSSKGDIAAGSAARTVSSAPPTRVVIDAQTASVQTDLSGLATGGGIGVLQTIKGAAVGDVDLIAPVGSVDAGDAGIRVSGNINVAAEQVINAGNIQTGGNSAGVPSLAPATPNIAALSAASANTQAATANATSAALSNSGSGSGRGEDASLISVEVLGYGEDFEDEDAV